MTFRPRRPATTLVEVLMAIFIVTIGLLALLTLFPMGLLQMAQAFKDQRSAEAAASSASLFRAHWREEWETANLLNNPATGGLYYDRKMNPQPQPNPSQVWASGDTGSGAGTANHGYAENYAPTLDNLNQLAMQRSTINQIRIETIPATVQRAITYGGTAGQYITGPNEHTASYPVYIDPIGWQARSQSSGLNSGRLYWLAGEDADVNTAIPRRTLIAYTPSISTAATGNATRANMVRRFALLDELIYTKARPADPRNPDEETVNSAELDVRSTTNVSRQMNYTTAWLIRRDSSSVRSRVHLTVVVYLKRSTETPSDETVVSAQFTRETKQATIYFPATGKPAIRRGTWLLDATPSAMNGTTNANVAQSNYRRFGPMASNFLRVVNVEEGTNSMTIEFQTTIPPGPTDDGVSNVPQALGRFIILDKVAEVFDKGAVEVVPFTRGS